MRWELRGDAKWIEHFRADWITAHTRQGNIAEANEVDGVRVYHKGSRLKPGASRRHAWRKHIARIPVPRIAEFAHLTWLRAQGFGAPEPLCAAVLWSGLLPVYQALVTRFVERSQTLVELLDGRRLDDAACASLGAEVARMHGSGFVHRDLFARNILRCDDGAWIFLDAWRGGTRRGWRGATWDLACLLEDVGEEHAAALIRAYAQAGAPLDLGRLTAERERVRRRYA